MKTEDTTMPISIETLPCQRRQAKIHELSGPDAFIGNARVSLVMVGRRVDRVLCDELHANNSCAIGKHPCYLAELDGD